MKLLVEIDHLLVSYHNNLTVKFVTMFIIKFIFKKLFSGRNTKIETIFLGSNTPVRRIIDVKKKIERWSSRDTPVNLLFQ